MTETPSRTKALLILAGMIWGTSFVTGKLGVEGMDPYLFTILRSAFSALSVVPFLLMKDFDSSLFKNKWLWFVALMNAAGLILQNVGLTTTTATNTVLLVDINVVIVAFMAAFILKERLNRRIVAGLVLGMVGVTFVATKGSLGNLGGGSFIGNLLVFIAGVAWAFYIVFTTRELKKGYSLLHLTCAMIMMTAILAIPMSMPLVADFSMNTSGVALGAYSGIFCTTIAFLLYNMGLKSLGATTTSIILLVEMVFGLLFSFLLLGERPDSYTIAGGGLILLAIVVISLKGFERGWASRHRS
ncbi:MAG: DMT family transporter [Methanomassiliicoccales archaeon]|nr:DMT family transporter [Methanomassiliicoccales archaeon]